MRIALSFLVAIAVAAPAAAQRRASHASQRRPHRHRRCRLRRHRQLRRARHQDAEHRPPGARAARGSPTSTPRRTVRRRAPCSSAAAISSDTGSSIRWRGARRPAIRGCAPPAARCRSCSRTTATRPASIGKWHLGYKPEFSPNAHGFDYFFGFKSGLIDYYQHTDQTGEHDLFENDAPTHVTGYIDRSLHRAVGEVHRAERQPAVLPRGGVQRGALAVPGARPPVGRARQRALRPAAGGSDQYATRLRRHPRARGSGRRKDSRDARRAWGSTRNTLVDLHAGQRRRVAVAQRAALPPQEHRVGRRHPRAGDLADGPDGFPPARRRRRSASSWTSPRRSLP